MTSRHKVGITVSFAAAIGLIVCVSGYLSMREILEANRRVTDTHVVLEKLGHLLSVLTDAETGQRGYILTGEPGYLDPYVHASSLSQRDIAALTELTRDNRDEQESLLQLRALSDARLARLQSTIEIRDKSGLDAAVDAIRSGQGKRMMDDLRAVIATMQGREQLLLRTRTDDAKASATRFMVVVAIWLPLLAILAVLMTRRSKGAQMVALADGPVKTRKGSALRYLFAIFVVAVAGVLRWWWGREFGQLPAFITFFPAVLIVACVAGSGPGLLATALSTLAAAFFFLEPLDSFAISSPTDLLTTAIFTGTNFFTCVLADRLQRSRAGEAISRHNEAQRTLLETVINSLPAAINLIRGSDMTLKLVNPAYQAIAPDVVMVGKTLDELWPKSAERLGEICRRVLITGEPHQAVDELNMIHRTPDGPLEAAYFSWSMFRVRLPGGEGWGILNTAWETTASKVAELALRESELRFRTMANAFPQLAWTARADGFIEWYNQGWYNYTGTSPNDMEGWGWQSVHDPLTLPLVMERWKVAIESGEPFEMAFPLRGADGRFRTFLTRVRPLVDEQGCLVQWFGTNTDIEDLKRAEEAHTRLAAIVESSDDAILSKRLDGTILTWNAAAERLFGYRAEDIVGTSISQLVPPERIEEEAGIIARLRRGEACEHIETLRVAKDGRRIDVSVTISPLKDRDGTVVGASKIARDITERKRAQEELATAMKAAERATMVAEAANSAKDRFIAVVSHELRTPLNPVLATCSMLLEDPRLDADVCEQLEMICRNVQIETRLIDDLLDVTRIDLGKVELDRRPVELGAVVRGVTETCKPETIAKKLEMTVDLPKAPFWVDGDVARLQQVFWNVIKNAIKFTPPGGLVEVRGTSEEDGYAHVQVVDRGIGISPALMGQIFNAFEHADGSITRRFGGMGLGLAITKALVELHGGTITARSDGDGKGTTFDVRLPLASVAAVQAMAAKPRISTTADKSTPEQPLRSMRILLVEDHIDTARIMSRLLRNDGHKVDHAADVASALRLLAEKEFDLLVSDLGLPDGNGWDIMRGLRERGSNLPGIALSGYGQDADIRNSLDAGYTAHLTKPINIGVLMTKVREIGEK
jgi:PAS domain S-box-containing protein